MAFQIPCECGAKVTVGVGAAGAAVPCSCGRTIPVPQLAELKRTAEWVTPERPRRKFALKKKLLFSVVVLAVVSLPLWLVMEVAYRVYFSIPLIGGVLNEDRLRMEDDPSNEEFAARFRISENPILFYEPRPGSVGQLYAINSQGFRDYEYPMEKDADVFRIVVLGDSIIWGHGLKLKDTFAKQIERALNDTFNQQFEVLNFGVSGYSTRQEVELFRVRASRFNPDLVIVGYCLNDHQDSSQEGEAFKRMYYDVFSKSYLWLHLKRVLFGLSYNTLGVTFGDANGEFDLRKQFKLLQSYCGGRRNLVVVFPVLYKFDDYLLTVEHNRPKAAVVGLNFELLDLLEPFSKHDARSFMLAPNDKVHPNERGTRIAVKATMDFLIEKQLIPTGMAAGEQ